MSTYKGFDRNIACHGYKIKVSDNGNVIKALDINDKRLFTVRLGLSKNWESVDISFEDLTLFDRSIFNGVPKLAMTFQGIECTEMSVSTFNTSTGFIDENTVQLCTEEGRFQASLVSDLNIDKYYNLLMTYNEAARVIPVQDKMCISYDDTPFADKIFDDIIITMQHLHREKS